VDVSGRKKRRKYYTFKFTLLGDYSEVFLDIGAFSVSQAKLLARKARSTLKMTSFKNENYWTSKKPLNAPEKGAFVMYKKEILKIS
jgi:hypothetical protein